MDWKDEPATQQQMLRLQEMGFVTNCPLTVTQAAQIIRQHHRSSRHPSTQERTAASRASRHEPTRVFDHGPAGGQADVSESARAHAYRLRQAVETARHALELTPTGPNVRADFHSTTVMRTNFWLDTCREEKEMEIGSVQVLELHQDFGARFYPPTADQVREVLDALDGAMAAWDKDHPEMFYETLRLNFPSQARPLTTPVM